MLGSVADTMPRFACFFFFVAGLLGLATLPACVIVPAYARSALTDPAMDPSSDTLERRAHRRLHTSREAAAGGDGLAAGGGCGCGN